MARPHLSSALRPGPAPRSRLRILLDHASSAELDDAAAQLAHALRNRAVGALLVASLRDLPDVRDDERVHLSGVSLPESHMSASAVAVAYVSSDDLDAPVGDYLLSPAPRSRANVILHVVTSETENPAIAALDDIGPVPARARSRSCGARRRPREERGNPICRRPARQARRPRRPRCGSGPCRRSPWNCPP